MDLPVAAHILEVEGDLGTGPPVTLVLHERWPAIEHPPRPWSELGGRSRTDYPDRIPEDEWRGVPRQIHLHADDHHQRMVYEEDADGSRIWVFYQIEANLFGHAQVRDCDVGWHRRSSLRSVTGKVGLVGTAVVDTVIYPLSFAYGIFVFVAMSFW